MVVRKIRDTHCVGVVTPKDSWVKYLFQGNDIDEALIIYLPRRTIREQTGFSAVDDSQGHATWNFIKEQVTIFNENIEFFLLVIPPVDDVLVFAVLPSEVVVFAI